MPTECSAERFEFAAVEGRAVVAGFDGGAITSDAGALLLGGTDRAIGRFAACFIDRRRPEYVEHLVPTLVGQRVGHSPPRPIPVDPPARAEFDAVHPPQRLGAPDFTRIPRAAKPRTRLPRAGRPKSLRRMSPGFDKAPSSPHTRTSAIVL